MLSTKKLPLWCALGLLAVSLSSCKQKIDFGELTDDPYNVGAAGTQGSNADDDADVQPEKGKSKFEVKAPSHVEVGQQFYVEYVISDAEGDDFSAPEFTDLEVLGGPSISQSSSVQIINGHATSSSTCSYVYVVQATKEGTFALPEATATIDGRKTKSSKRTITVGSGAGGNSSTANAAQGNGNSANSGANGSGSKSDENAQNNSDSTPKGSLFFTVDATKRKVYEQEPIVLTFKVHSKPSLGLANLTLQQKPDLKGFWSQEIALPRTISSEPERRGDEIYGVGNCLKYVVFPQKTGTLTVPPVVFACEVTQRGQGVDPFDAFFNGGGNMRKRVERQTDKLDIEVLPLPEKPAGFSGGVGQFSVDSKLLTAAPKTNDVVTMRLTVNGVGNLGLLKAPTINFPESFETYDAKKSEKTEISEQGLTGDVYFDYTFVPREVGKFDIPAVSFIYFDTEKNEYVTLRTAPVHLDIKKGARSKEDLDAEIAMRNSDIHDINLDTPHEVCTEGVAADATWIGSPLYFACLALLIGVLSALTVFLRRRAAREADVTGTRNRQARKKANKHLREAEKALATGDHKAFYSALAQALRGFFADKLATDAAALTNDSILGALAERGLDAETLEQTKELLEDCDFARFAPAHDASQREHDLERASELLNRIDQKIK